MSTLKKVYTAFFLIILFHISCTSDSDPAYTELNLLEYGFPIKLLAPDSAKVDVNDLAFMKDITVIHESSNYSIQILVSKASERDEKGLLAYVKKQTELNPYFADFTLEEDRGFVFKNLIDSMPSYDFRYVRIKGDREYIYQTGLSTNFTEEEVIKMYESVKGPQ
jgi:hypothetical protein